MIGSPHPGSGMFGSNPYADMYSMHGHQISAMNAYATAGNCATTDQMMSGSVSYGTHQSTSGMLQGLPGGSTCNMQLLSGSSSSYNSAANCSAVPTDYSPPAGTHPCSLSTGPPSASATAGMNALSAAAAANNTGYSMMFPSLYDRLNGNEHDNNYNYGSTQHQQQTIPQSWPHQNTDQTSQNLADLNAYNSAHQRFANQYKSTLSSKPIAPPTTESTYKNNYSGHRNPVKQQPLSPSGSTGSMQSVSPASSEQSPYNGNHLPTHNPVAPLHMGGAPPNNYLAHDTPVDLVPSRGQYACA